jgi:hypothetical protein
MCNGHTALLIFRLSVRSTLCQRRSDRSALRQIRTGGTIVHRRNEYRIQIWSIVLSARERSDAAFTSDSSSVNVGELAHLAGQHDIRNSM